MAKRMFGGGELVAAAGAATAGDESNHAAASSKQSRRKAKFFRKPNVESQRDSGLQPRVARNELPWESGPKSHNPNGVAA
ncbi:hypothetical protein LBMAG56_27550 [Verrucomicrobiota bacterium]|nr:hypothetical protein LBMAG56_27550 [Verrucomicrobiota bacterium]